MDPEDPSTIENWQAKCFDAAEARAWIWQPGIPKDAPLPTSARFDGIERAPEQPRRWIGAERQSAPNTLTGSS